VQHEQQHSLEAPQPLLVDKIRFAYRLKEDNLEEQFSHLLGGKVRLFVPSCALRELQQLAKDDKLYKAAAALARKFVRHKDACPPEMPNSECLLKQLGASQLDDTTRNLPASTCTSAGPHPEQAGCGRRTVRWRLAHGLPCMFIHHLCSM
jgi:rRNA-processing protein FCF1